VGNLASNIKLLLVVLSFALA